LQQAEKCGKLSRKNAEGLFYKINFMSLSIGIVGLPNVGKSTLFNTLTKNKVEASNYPFCTIDPNVGVVKVPDERLEKLAQTASSKEIIPTIIEFTDIAGLVKGAHKGEGLGNKFLANIRECDAICQVTREFQDENIVHVDGRIDSFQDVETINLELIMADLASVSKQLEKITREARGGDKVLIAKKELLEKLKKNLDLEKAIRDIELTEDEEEIIKSFSFLTIKPIIYVKNVNDKSFQNPSNLSEKLGQEVSEINIKLEEEIAELDEADKEEYMKELGITQSGLEKLVKSCYKMLGLITFFTVGPQEARAWTIEKGAKAPEAGGVIHSDFCEKFIRAEIIDWQNFIQSGSEQNAREKGLIKTEGKNYEMRDGDVCHFLHS